MVTAVASREPGRDGANLPADVQALVALLAQRAAERVDAALMVQQMLAEQSTEPQTGRCRMSTHVAKVSLWIAMVLSCAVVTAALVVVWSDHHSPIALVGIAACLVGLSAAALKDRLSKTEESA